MYPGEIFIVVLYFHIDGFHLHKCCCILHWILFLVILLNSVFLISIHFYVLLVIAALCSMGDVHFWIFDSFGGHFSQWFEIAIQISFLHKLS